MFSAVNTVAVSAEDLAKTTPAEFGAAMVASLNLQVGGQGTNPSIVSITVTISETVELQVDAGPSLSSSNLLAATKAAACTGMAGTCSVSNLQGRRQLRHAGARREGREEFALGGRELALEGRELALGDRTLEARRRLGTGLTVTREYDYGASANSSTSVSALIESSLEDVDVTSSVMTALSARSAVTALAEGDGSGSDVAGQLDASSLTDMLALLLPSVGVDVSEPLVVTPPAAPPHPSPLPPPAYPGPSAPPARPETVAQLTLFISLLACGLAVLLAIVGVALWLGCRSHRPPTSVRVLPNTRGAGGTKTQMAQGPSRVQGAGYRVQEAQGPSSPSRARHEGAWLASKGLGAAGDHVMDVAGTGYRVQGKGLGAAGDHVMDVAAVSVSSAASARDGVTAAASVSSAATGPRPTYDETTPYVADGYARGEMAGGGGVGLEDGRAASQPARPPRYDREGVEIVEIDDAHPEPPPSPAPLGESRPYTCTCHYVLEYTSAELTYTCTCTCHSVRAIRPPLTTDHGPPTTDHLPHLPPTTYHLPPTTRHQSRAPAREMRGGRSPSRLMEGHGRSPTRSTRSPRSPGSATEALRVPLVPARARLLPAHHQAFPLAMPIPIRRQADEVASARPTRRSQQARKPSISQRRSQRRSESSWSGASSRPASGCRPLR